MKQTATRLLSFYCFALGLGYLLALLGGGCPAAFAASRTHGAGMASPTAIVYTWSATGTSASWSASGSWTPARTSPDPSDILQFVSNGAAPTVLIDFGASQTIAGLFISTGSALTFSTDGTDGTNIGFGRTLTIANGSAGADLTLSSSSTLTVYTSSNYSANTGLIVALGTGATATIGGHLVFDAIVANTNTPATSHAIQGNGAASIEFTTGSIFTTQANFRGNPFGSGTALANSVAFRNGSRYEYTAGNNPFVLTQPATITNFEPTSTFYFAPASSGSPAFTGRTYGHFEYNNPGSSSSPTGANAVTIAGNLILTAGTLNINLTGGILLKGDVLMNGGTLNFTPASAATVQFAGATTQTIGGVASSGPVFGLNATVQVNNAAGLALGQAVSLLGTLQLTSGLLTTSATNLLTLGSAATISGGSDNSFVNGPVARPVPVTSNASGTFTSYVFPVGKGSAYRPLTLSITTQGNAVTYRAEQFEGNPGQNGANPTASNGSLTRVSRAHSYTVTPFSGSTVTQPTGFQGRITLSFGLDDQVTNAASLRLAKRADNSQPWASIGLASNSVNSTSGGYQSGTATSGSFTSFSDFALASTDADPTINPLPVQLIRFRAVRAAQGGVALAWTTASELRSAHFEVERSLDGNTFRRVAIVPAAGSSAQAREYTNHDDNALPGQLHYRLRMVDVDGTAAYSPVATVATDAASGLTLAPSPAHDYLALFTEVATPYLVHNTLGLMVLAGTTLAGSPTPLDVRSLAAGVYFLELPGLGRVVRKFVKE